MGWTLKRIRSRESDGRHRPGLEHLDQRLLLSTGAGTSLPYHVAPILSSVTHKAPAHVHRLARASAHQAQTAPVAQPQTQTERPAGAIATGATTAFDPLIGSAAARATYGVDGTGMTVAVIDTGVDYNNPALGGAFGPGAKVVAGYNFASNSPDPMATSSQHGTAVAGLIGSSDPSHLGVAPGVQIVALRVVGDNNVADLSNIARALQWVIDNHAQYHINVINMSLSDGGNYAHNWFAQDGGVGQQITGLIGQLQNLNIPVVSATGNSFNGQQGEGFTAIVGGVVSVTATDTTDHLLPDAQRLGSAIGMGTMTDVAAPGKGILAPSGDSGYSTVEGTSFATPLVTGAIVLLQQIYQGRFGTLPTVAQVTQWIEQGSDPIYDPTTGLTIGRLDIPNAASLIPSPSTNTAPVTVSVPTSPPVTASTTTTPVTQVSYTPITPTPATSTPAPAAQVLVNPPAPSPPAQAADPTPSPDTFTISPGVEVFVNGKQVSALDASGASLLPLLPQTSYDSLLKAMSAWAAGTTASQSGSGQVSQVRIWTAASQAAGGIATGSA